VRTKYDTLINSGSSTTSNPINKLVDRNVDDNIKFLAEKEVH